ncbi:sensor histidine kinase [Paenibacillus sepulcri]|uniref:histidine kinase n=1 Tax=Paenibacillus sepulcri TaxID=359917 RepID=A0ABS7C2W4_9BACL|nr:HAMP domain-containing histidine kinase [Paenibacillus sepulcri]
MVIKLKNRLSFGFWAIMFTFGLSGLLVVFTFGSNYVHRDYFHTPEFRSELDLFAQYLNMFELNSITFEEAKQSITVSEDEINDYRNGLGNITNLINSLKGDYQLRIDEASLGDNQEAVDIYIAERDKQIEDITEIFKSNEYARAKVINQKEEELKEYYKEREQYRTDFLRYINQFQYYFKSSLTDKVYTNSSIVDDESVTDKMNSKNMLFMTSYSIPTEQSIFNSNPVHNQLVEKFIPFKGEFAVTRDLSSTSSVMIDYNRYNQEKITLWVYTFASLAALILCVVFGKKAIAIPSIVERWTTYYNKLPIDVRALFIILTSVGTVCLLFFIRDQFIYVYENPFDYGWNMFIGITFASLFLVITIIQSKIFAVHFKDWPYIKKEWEKGLLNKAWQSVKSLYNQAKRSLTDAFLNKSTGAQMFILLMIVFGLGLAGMMMGLHPGFILLYVILFAVIGLPIVLLLIIRIGYFNRIVIKTNELAVGNLGQDLPISGKSVLATLAENINVLKQGVRTLQNEQAKSERLKTELITNVSHDLRTPLTSIITYTELLKKEDLSSGDRIAYVEIIDRKSKRLKVLIDDLFEVSKMASGNVELTKEKVDLAQLLQQALAEYDNMINDSSLRFRITNSEEPVYAFVDGQKLWRVFDNLIGNVLKYSLENSRVYITVRTLNNHAIIAFKNVSKYEISENMDELFERFKRGDSSRHTEGSGLGLAIAKSIVDLHEGNLDIEIDGDLFKVRISLPLEK